VDLPERVLIAAGCLAFGSLLLSFRYLTKRPGSARDRARALFAWEGAPWIGWRMGVVVAPILGPIIIASGLLFLLPRLVSAWLSIPLGLAVLGTVAVCYRIPLWLMPAWMRDEIARAELSAPRPDRFDRLILVVLAPVISIGSIGVAVLIVVFHAAG